MSRSPEPESWQRANRRDRFHDNSGFTLIEVLVAFVVMTTMLSVFYRSVVTLRSGAIASDLHMHQNFVARAVLEDALDKRELASGTYTGIRDGLHWSLVAMPANLGAQLPRPPPPKPRVAAAPKEATSPSEASASDDGAPQPAKSDDKPQWTPQRLVVRVGAHGRPLEIETLRLVKRQAQMMREAYEHSKSHRKGDDGFLLTETLATFTISACVLVGLASISTVLLRVIDRSITLSQDVDDLGRTVETIARDISGLARARWDGIEPQHFVFRGGPNSLFFAKIQRDSDGAEETRVIALREVVAGRGTRLMRSEARLSGRAQGFDALLYATPRELRTGTARLRFAYVPIFTGQAARQTLDAWPEGTTLPASVMIMAMQRDTGRVIFSMRVPIHATADIGCVDRETTASASPTAPINASPPFCSRTDSNKRSGELDRKQDQTASHSTTGQKL